MDSKTLFINLLALLVLLLAPVSRAGADSVAESRNVLSQHKSSGKAGTSGREERPGEAETGEAEGPAQGWEPDVTVIGDVRAGVVFNQKGKGDGDDLATVTPALRLRGGVAASLLPWLEATARVAVAIDNTVEGFAFQFNVDGGLEPGDVTFDELFLTLKPHDALTIEGGRLQTAFQVESVVGDSLSRHDSPGFDITWTDGLYAIIGRPSALQFHLIGQANPTDGPTNGVGARGPISFEDGASRFTYYAALQAPPVKPFTQLVADVTIIPQALRPEGLGTDAKENVVAFTVKAAADFPLTWLQPIILHPFGEFGVMAWTPQEDVLKVSSSTESAGRFAVVAGLDLKKLGPGALGFQFNWTQPGYLISPDYPNNTWSMETRYKVPIVTNVIFEVRYRHRQQIEKLVGAAARQTDDNVQARVTVTF
jgi:hypothetical protein